MRQGQSRRITITSEEGEKLADIPLAAGVVGVMLPPVGVWAAGLMAVQVAANRMTRGDERSDDFQIAAICGGKKFHSQADHLKTGTVIASMGGIELDLRDATLDPAGASLELKTTMGGVQVIVPENWAVDVDQKSLAGGFDVRVTPPDDLPQDAPRLHVLAVNRMGGGVVTTDAA